jgi:hypothetical protein
MSITSRLMGSSRETLEALARSRRVRSYAASAQLSMSSGTLLRSGTEDMDDLSVSGSE